MVAVSKSNLPTLACLLAASLVSPASAWCNEDYSNPECHPIADATVWYTEAWFTAVWVSLLVIVVIVAAVVACCIFGGIWCCQRGNKEKNVGAVYNDPTKVPQQGVVIEMVPPTTVEPQTVVVQTV